MTSPSTLDEFLHALPAMAAERRAALLGHDGLLLIETRQGRKAYIRLADGRVSIEETASDTPTCTVLADEKILLDMIAGRTGVMKALVLRKVSVKGNAAALVDLVRVLS